MRTLCLGVGLFAVASTACGGGGEGGGGSGPPDTTSTFGTLRAITAPAGLGTDANGFAVTLNGTSIGVLERRDTLEVSNLAPGPYTLALSDLAANCVASGTLQRSVALVAATKHTETFTIDCLVPLQNRILMDTQGDLYSFGTTLSDLEPLLQSPDPVDYPSPSPSGVEFAYATFVANVHRVAIARADGTNSHLVGPACAEQPDWSPDGVHIAFMCRDNNGNGDIYIMNPDGSGPINITQTADTNEEHPSWSPDGSHLVAFASGAGGGLFTVAANGSQRTPVTLNDADRAPEWASVGDRIVFTRPGGAGQAIYTITSTGANEAPLTGTDHFDKSPTWSPDGQQVAFVRDLGTSFDLFLVNADGTNEHRVTFGISIGNPRWAQ